MTPTLAQPDAGLTAPTDPLVQLNARLWRGGVALAALCFVALLPALFAPFFADDYFHIEHLTQLGEALTRGWVLLIEAAGAWWTPPGLAVEYFRPLVVLSFAFDHLVYGGHAVGYHLTNLLLHLATTLLLWGIARRVLGAGFAAWVAAALFAIHPAHTVAVSWISGRTDVLATAFYAAAFLLYLESRAPGRVRVPALALACVSFAVALLAKEMAITLPAVVLGHSLLVRERERATRLATFVGPVAIAAVGVAYLALRIGVLGGFRSPPTPFAFHPGDPGLALHLVTAPLLYLADLVIFVPADPMATVPFWHAHPVLLVAFLAFIVFIFAGTLKKAGDRFTAVWGLGWMAITILPVMMLTVGEHFLYLPSMGYCVLVASQLPSSPAAVDGPRRRGLAIVAALVTVVCIGRTALFTHLSRNAERAIDEAVAAVEAAPAAERVLVIDVPASAALAFPHAVRMALPARALDVEILSVVPRFLASADAESTVTFTAPDRFELRREGGYLTSYLERAFEGPRRRFQRGQIVERPGFEVTIVDVDASSRPLAFDVHVLDRETTLVLGPGRSAKDVSSAGESTDAPGRGDTGLQPISPH